MSNPLKIQGCFKSETLQVDIDPRKRYHGSKFVNTLLSCEDILSTQNSAKQILDERLAKGEISVQEYKEVLETLSASSSSRKNDYKSQLANSKVNARIHIILLSCYFLCLMVLFMLLGGDIIDRWSPYTDRPFAFLFLLMLLMNIFIGISFKWNKFGRYGALILAAIAFLYFASISIDYLDEASSLITNLLLVINIIAVYIFIKITEKR